MAATSQTQHPIQASTIPGDLVIWQLDIAVQFLAQAKTIQDTKKILDTASAAEVYAKRQRLSQDAIAYAHDVKFVALRRLGQLLREMPKATGGQPYQERSTGYKSTPVETLADLGLDKKISWMAQRLAALPEAEFGQLRAGRVSMAQILRAANPSQAAWSIDGCKERLIAFLNAEIDDAPPETTPLIMETARGLLAEYEEAAQPEWREAVAIARDELTIHDSEPGGYRVFEDEHQAGFHPGAPNVVASCKSTHSPCYKDLTTRKPGVTALKREQVESRLTDIEKGKLPTARTEHTHFSVLCAIKELPQTSPLGRGVRGER